MILTEEEIKQIIREETLDYLEEVKGSMSLADFERFLKHVPFTKPHRKAHGEEAGGIKDLEVYELVVGGPGQAFRGKQRKDWPLDIEDKEIIASWFVRSYPDINSIEDILDKRTGEPKMKWSLVQRLVKKKFAQEPEVRQAKKRFAGIEEIIKEEVIKYLKENE